MLTNPSARLLLCALLGCGALAAADAPRMKLGAYYFDGWAGHSSLDDGKPEHAWAKGMPTHFTPKLAGEYSSRMPVWGWRSDTVELMERQIDLAADHGLAFFSFCWYWRDNKKAINIRAIEETPTNTGVRLFQQAKNNRRMEFCLLVANHQGSEIEGTEAWKQAADYWIQMFRHPRYLRLAGKPVIVIFSPRGADKAGLAYLQTAARQAGFPGVEVAGCGGGKVEDGFTLQTRYNVKPPRTPNSPLSEAHSYQELVDANVKAWSGTAAQPLIPLATAGWDRRPWEGVGGLGANGVPISWYFENPTPAAFAGMLERMAAWMDANPEQATKDRLALVYAWNEMGEGGWLVPTKGDPDGAWLKAIRGAVLPQASKKAPARRK